MRLGADWPVATSTILPLWRYKAAALTRPSLDTARLELAKAEILRQPTYPELSVVAMAPRHTTSRACSSRKESPSPNSCVMRSSISPENRSTWRTPRRYQRLFSTPASTTYFISTASSGSASARRHQRSRPQGFDAASKPESSSHPSAFVLLTPRRPPFGCRKVASWQTSASDVRWRSSNACRAGYRRDRRLYRVDGLHMASTH